MLGATGALALEAGVARVEITPHPAQGVPMSGYTDGYDLRAEGVHDPLFARVLVLDDGMRRIALAAVDLIGLNVDFTPASGRLPRLLGELGITGWLIVATHTHGGPKVLHLGEPYSADRSWPAGNPYLTWVEDQIAAGAAQAWARRQPVRLSVGRGRVDLTFNRRLVRPDGGVEMIWGQGRQVDPALLGPTNPEVGVIRLDDSEGRMVALLFNYACHPVVLGSGNRLLTADFPGAAMAYLEKEFPGAVALFLQGAAGDLDPYVDLQNQFGAEQEQGEELGEEVARVASETIPLEEEPQITWTPLLQTFRHFYNPDRQVIAGFEVLQLGRWLAFLGLPGEPFVALQLEFKARSPLPFAFLLGYANGYAGYLPTRQASREGGYGASEGGTLHLEAGAGEAMVARGLEVLDRQVWLEPLPDTLISGRGIHRQIALRPALLEQPSGPGGVALDLSSLGGPALLPLAEMGEGVYGGEVELALEIPPGRRGVTVQVRQPSGEYLPYCTRSVWVLPGGDLEVLGRKLAAGWQVEEGKGATFGGWVDFAGRPAMALEVEPGNTGSLADFWTVDLCPAEPIELTGYQRLRLAIHPGTTEESAAPWLGLFVDDQRVDLRPWLDPKRKAWQTLELDLADLNLEEALERIRLWGRTRGTLYLAGVSLVAARGPEAPTWIGEVEEVPLLSFQVAQNWPNPFNGATAIRFSLETPQEVEVAVYNLAGQLVAVLLKGECQAGVQTANWDGRDSCGREVASGVYLCCLRAGGKVATRKMALLR